MVLWLQKHDGGLEEPQSKTEDRVRSWGFPITFTCHDEAYSHFPPHYHDRVTTNLVRRGTLTVTCTGGMYSLTQVLGPGERLDIPAGQEIELRMGIQGAEYTVGEK